MRLNPVICVGMICGAALFSVPLFSPSPAQFTQTRGLDGAQFYMQAGAPSNALGNNGDAYVDTVTGNAYQKVAGAWIGPVMNILGPQGSTGSQGSQGTTGATGSTGATGGFTAYGQPSARTFTLGTAYQCTNNTKPCIFTVTLTSTASLSLSGGTTNTADLVIGTTSGIATSGGTLVAQYSNTLTGTLTVSLAANSNSNNTYTISMPAAGFFAIRGTSGAVTVVNSSVEQTVS